MTLIARLIFAISLLAAASVLACLFILPAKAADYGGTPSFHEWIESLMQPGGAVSCCSEADRVKPITAWVAEGHWQVRLPDGRQITIPDDRIIRPPRPNPTGEPVLFMSPNEVIFCFVAPPEV